MDSVTFFNDVVSQFLMLWAAAQDFLRSFIGLVIGVSIILSIFFFIAIIYCVEGLKLIREKESTIYEAKVEPAYEDKVAGDTAMAHRWESAMAHLESPNQNDWKQAVMEADILLDDLLTKMGYRGESVGEKLKRVEPGDMKSLNDAWEAHKVRNQIAHEPGFQLDHHVARHTLHQYRKVFEEFYYI